MTAFSWLQRRSTRWWLAALTLLGFVLRVHHLDFQSFWRDEVDAILFATRPLAELLRTFGKSGENGPLFFLMLRPWLQWLGQSEFALRFFSVIWGTLAVPLTWHISQNMTLFFAGGSAAHPRVGLVAALFVATSPYFVWYSQEGKMYALVLTLALASTLAWLAALQRGGRARWLFYIGLTSLGFYMHVLFVLLLPVHATIFALGWPRTRARLTGACVAAASFTLPYVPLVWWQWKLFTSPTFEPGFAFVPLPRLLAILFAAFGRGMRTEPSLAWAAVWIFLLLAGLFLARPKRATVALVAWLLGPPVLLFLISLRVPLFNDRYLIYVGAGFYVLAAWGLVAVAQRNRAVALVVGILALSLNFYGVWGQATTPIKSDFRAAAAFVQAHAAHADIVIFLQPYSRFPYAAYAGWNYAWREAPFTNDRARVTLAATGETLDRLTEGAQFVWLVESEAENWDRRGFNRQWLTAHARVVADATFTGVRVTRFAKP